MKKFRMRGFTFIEIMLVLVVLAASIAGVYLMLKPASLKAGVEKEQRNLSQLVSEIQGSFGRTQGTYADLTVEKLKELRPQGIRFDSLAAPGGGSETKIVSKFNDSISVRPAEVKRPNDAFDIVYENLNDKKCYNFIKTFYPQSYGIYVGTSEQSVQEVVGLNEGRIASDEVLFAACGTSEFKTNQGTVVFRFYEPTAFSSVVTDSACGCTPETQTQDLPCGPSQVGVIRQERTNDCSGGTPSCPAPNWSAWTTTGNTCSGAPVPMTPQTPVAPPAAQCIPGQLFQNLGCAAGETGQITQRRDVTCPSPTGVPVMGAWVTIQNTCATPSSINATCSTGVQSRFTACPVGQIGNVTERRTAECSGPFAVPVYGAWTETSRSCRVACADAGSCCQPLPDQNRPLSCPAGFWGTGTEERNSWCVAASPTTPLAWSAWHITAGVCTACPAPSTATETRWTAQGGYTCPAGQYGSNTWEREEQRSQTTTYNCPAGTPVEPPPTISAWTGWTPTGATRNPVNTCTACPANTTTPQLRWDPRSAACPIGQVGSNTWEARQTRDENTTYSCPAGTATAPSPTVTYTPWTDTGATRNVVNTCAVPACSGPNSQNQWLPTSASCPAGFVGSRDWEREQVQTRTCSSPPVWDAWSGWTDTGAIRNYVDSCVAASCPGSATDTQWVATSGPCDPGFTGTKNWEREQTRSRTCSTPPAWDAWSGWTDTGVTRNPTDTCVPSSCAGPASQTQWIPMNPGCPAGYSGTNTFEKEQIQTRTCTTPPAWDAWGGWTDTGATRNPVYTCVPNNCSIPAGTTFNWTVAGQSCTYTTAGVTPVSHGANFTANDVTPAPVGTANFACNLGVMNMTALPGATCTVGCVPPAPTDTPVYRAAPVETRTIACAAGFTGSISQERTRDEIGNDNTTWSCPGPTPTNTTTWSGTYTNFGGWVTTSDTCVPTGGGCWSGVMAQDTLSAANWWCPSFNNVGNSGRIVLEGPSGFWVANNYGGSITITGWDFMGDLSAACAPNSSPSFSHGYGLMPDVGQPFPGSSVMRTAGTPIPAECADTSFPESVGVGSVNSKIAGGSDLGNWYVACTAWDQEYHQWPCVPKSWTGGDFGEYMGPYLTYNFQYGVSGMPDTLGGGISAPIRSCLTALGSLSVAGTVIPSVWPAACSCSTLGPVSLVYLNAHPNWTDAAGSTANFEEYTCP